MELELVYPEELQEDFQRLIANLNNDTFGSYAKQIRSAIREWERTSKAAVRDRISDGSIERLGVSVEPVGILARLFGGRAASGAYSAGRRMAIAEQQQQNRLKIREIETSAANALASVKRLEQVHETYS